MRWPLRIAVVAIMSVAAPAVAEEPGPSASPEPPAAAAPVPDAPAAATEAPAPAKEAPAVATEAPKPAPKEAAVAPVMQRFTLTAVDGGYLRLDGATGQVSFCAAREAGWTCRSVPEDRVALENEIARLQGEVARLSSEVAALREPPPPRPPAELAPPKPAEPNAGKSADKGLRLPSNEDIDRARAIVEDAWRRIVDMIDAMRKDLMRRT